jgi:hypothetical protein
MPVSKGRKKAKKRPTPPSKKDPAKAKGPSPLWYVILMFGLMGVGLVIILVNYMDVLPGGTDSKYLLAGLAGIGVGFAMTMNYR